MPGIQLYTCGCTHSLREVRNSGCGDVVYDPDTRPRYGKEVMFNWGIIMPHPCSDRIVYINIQSSLKT